MSPRYLLAALFLILIPSCNRAEVGGRSKAGAPIVFRVEVEEDTEGAISYIDHDGGDRTIWFGPAHTYTIQNAYAATGVYDQPAVGFKLSDNEHESFVDFTESIGIANRRMAIEVDGKILTAPHVLDRLPGQGMITGGVKGYSKEQANDLVAFLLGEEGVNHSWENN